MLERFCQVLLYFTLPLLWNNEALKFYEERKLHTPLNLLDEDLARLVQLSNESYFRDALGHILVPRVVGTSSHERVKTFIGSELEHLGWQIEYDAFYAETPNFGTLQFTNVIAHRPANRTRRLILACHYDSKFFKNFEFLGAIDSAAPCAMLMHLAKVIGSYIDDSKISLTLVFFDGEEAFENWSNYDSLYGARALAAKWEAEPFPLSSHTTNNLHRIDLLILLDLLGVKNQKLYSFFRETENWHSMLSRIEKRLKAMSLIPSDQPLHFLEKSTFGLIEDDHLPFLQRNVPILHLIPAEFPEAWHTPKDNYSILDFPTIDTMNKVLQIFVYAYLHGTH